MPLGDDSVSLAVIFVVLFVWRFAGLLERSLQKMVSRHVGEDWK